MEDEKLGATAPVAAARDVLVHLGVQLMAELRIRKQDVLAFAVHRKGVVAFDEIAFHRMADIFQWSLRGRVKAADIGADLAKPHLFAVYGSQFFEIINDFIGFAWFIGKTVASALDPTQ